jgi:RNA polymerase sigma factor (sigma-70 family)
MSGPIDLEALAKKASGGDADALERVLAAVRGDVLLLARRMLGDPGEAEDATQEILVKVMTGLGGFRGESALRTWVFRIAANTLMAMKRGKREIFSFEMMQGFIEGGLAAGVPAPPSADASVLAEEVMVGCTQGALLSLDRDQRLALTLVDLLELEAEEAAAALEVEAATLRKRLQRARERLREFMSKKCGIVDPANPCRCAKMSGFTVAQGLIDPEHLVHHARAARVERGDPPIEELLTQLQDLDARIRAILRSHPSPKLSAETAERIAAILRSGKYQMFDA